MLAPRLDAFAIICHEGPLAPSQFRQREGTALLARPTKISPLLDLRYQAEYVGLRFLIGLVRLLPLDISCAISAKMWRWIGTRNRRHKRALANLERAFPEKTPEERERIARAAWENLGRVMVETMCIDRILNEPDRLHVTDGHWITRYREKMGPVLIVTMHMGNWELGMWPVTLAGVRPAGVYRQVKNPYVDRYLRSQREWLYPGGLFGRGRAPGKDETQKTARLIMDYVRQGGRLGFISDLYDANGIAVPFFGHPAKSMPIAAMIARRVGARIWIGRCVRIGKRACFDVNVNELSIPRTSNQAQDIRSITAAIQRYFETWIRETPEQFMWSNRRWS
jgi:Kdo2-lipid IVA lauroyltransferase/acyltransferase